MIIRSRTTVFAATALVLVAGLAGCTASGTAAPPSSESASGAPGDVTLDPLSEFFRTNMSVSASDEESQKYQELVKQCMEEQGFEYTITTPSSDGNGRGTSITPTRKWVEEHGYGVVETTFHPDDFIPESESDPNLTYAEGLSEAQRIAYDDAMGGKAAASGDPDELDWQDKGCNGKASHEAFTQPEGTPPPIINDAQTFLNSLINDPMITAIDGEWAACMSRGGYPGQEQRMVRRDGGFTARASEYAAAHPDATSEDPEVVKMQADEITQALADWDCADQMHYDKRFFATLADLEKDYIAKNKGELEEAKLWLNNK